MRIPPYYRKPTWQQFFAGAVIGGLISWLFFLFVYGEWQEGYSKKITIQEERIAELENEKLIWQEEYKKLNKKNQQQLIVQSIYIKIQNYKKYDLDALSALEVEDAIKEDITIMIAKDINTVYNSRELIKRMIENKQIKVNDKRYRLQVKELTIYTTLSIEVEMSISD